MDCAEIRQGFMTGGVPSGQAVAEHVRWCPHCAQLLRNAAALGRRLATAVGGESAELDTQLVATEALLAKERGLRAFLRSRSTRVRWALSLTLPALLLACEALRRRIPWRALGSSRLFLVLLLFGLLGLVAHSALRPLPIARRAARARSVLAGLAWCLPCVLWFSPEARASSEDLSGSFALRSLTCFGYGSALAAPSFALLWAMDRGVQVSYQVWALGAGTVALVANSILLLHCPSTDRAHLMMGHFSIGLAWLLATSAIWWTRPVGDR